jgi:nitroreductase
MPVPIPAEDLAEVLEVARWTGSGMNRQPWTSARTAP